MERDDSVLLDKVRGLAAARDLIERALEEAINEAVAQDVCRSALATAAGVHRATFYRRYVTGTDTERQATP